MGLVNLETLMIVNKNQFDLFLSNIDSNLTISDSSYVATLILSNILAYFFILLFISCLFLVLRIVKRKIRGVFS